MPIIFLCNCSFLYLFETPFSQAKLENDIEELNRNLAQMFSEIIDAKKLKGITKYTKNEKLYPIEILNIMYAKLIEEHKTYLKKYQNDPDKSIRIYDFMNDFLELDPIAISYQNHGNHKYVYDAFKANKKVGILGFYGTIENLDSYRKYAKENIKGVAEYENLREKYFKEVILLKEEIRQRWKSIDSDKMMKDFPQKKFCGEYAYVLSNNLIRINNFETNCIYKTGGLEMLDAFIDGYIIGDKIFYPRSSDIFVYKLKRNDSINYRNVTSMYIYYAGLYSYDVSVDIGDAEFLGTRTLRAFKQIDMSKYPWISK